MNNLYKNLEWIKFYTFKNEPFYYFPDNMTLIEYDENFGKLLTDLRDKEVTSIQENEYPEGYVEDVLYNMEVLHNKGTMKKIIPSSLPDFIPLNKIIMANTLKCNLSCTYCYNKFGINSCPPEDMSEETFRKVTEFLEHNGPNLPFYKLYFIGGEPLVNLQILEEAGKWGERLRKKGRNLFIAVTTNGTLINKDIIDFCMKYRINLKLTVDGNEMEHNLHRIFPDGNGSYGKVRDMLPDYFYYYRNPSKYVATTIDTLESDLEDRVIRLAAMGFNIIDLTEIYTDKKEETYKEEDLENIFREKYRKVFEFLYLRVRSRNYLRIIPVYDTVKNIHFKKPSFSRCTAGLDSLSVAHDGTIYPCHHFYGDKRFAMGTVYEREISPDKFKPYRIPVTERSGCSVCWARLLCGGPCYHRSLAVTGDAFLCNKIECIRRKALIIEAFRFYIRLKNEDPVSLKYFLNMDKYIRSL